MTADILTNIHNKLTTFSKGQRRIATYILESYDKAAFLTAGALGKITQVSESTVVRFAAELGYDGYPAMQRALQEMVLNRLTSVQRIEVTDERLGEQDVVSTILQADMDRLRHTNEHLDREAGAQVIALTDSETAPIARSAHYLLTAKSDMVSLVDSLVAPMSVVNALIVALTSRRKHETAQTLDRLEQVWDQYHVYEKVHI